MTEHASEEGQVQEDDLQEHSRTEEDRETAEASSGDSVEQGGQEEAPSRPPMITPWYSDIDQN